MELDDSLSSQASLRSELVDMKSGLEAKDEANAVLTCISSELEEDSKLHYRNWRFCESECSETTIRAFKLEVKLTNETNRAVCLDEI